MLTEISKEQRLLSLLLIHIFVVFAVPAITGVSSSPKFKISLIKGSLNGGNPLVRTYIFMSRCSKGYVRMFPSKKIDALGISDTGSLAQIVVKSVPGEDGALQIQGKKSQRYLCFSRKGKPIGRYNGRSRRCRFHEINHHGLVKFKSVVGDWYLGFNKNGNKMKGTAYRTKRHKRKCFYFSKKHIAPLDIHATFFQRKSRRNGKR